MALSPEPLLMQGRLLTPRLVFHAKKLAKSQRVNQLQPHPKFHFKSAPRVACGCPAAVCLELHSLQSSAAAFLASLGAGSRPTTRERKTKLPSKTSDPNTVNVCGAPMRFATPPAISAPIGWTPMNIVAYTAITRLRSSSGTRFWTRVFVAAICDVAANPTTNSTPTHNQKTFAPEKISKPIAQVIEVAAIHRANPL